MHKQVHAQNTPECQKEISLKLVDGTIPAWLNGSLYRIGPGTFDIQQEYGMVYTIRHAFDGLPMIHRFQINGATNTLTYNSRHTAKSTEKRIETKQDQGLVFFGHVPDLSFFSWLMYVFIRFDQLVLRPKPPAPDNAAVGVTITPNYTLPSNEKSMVAKTDANILQKIHSETLKPELIFSYKDYDSRLDGLLSAAHHQYDPNTGEQFNYSLHIYPPKITIFKTTTEGQTVILAEISKNFRPSYIHSFYLTQNYVIIPQSPLVYAEGGINMLLHGSALSSMRWLENKESVFHVIRRTGGLVASVSVPTFFTFHVANAFEESNLLHLDSSAFPDGDILYQVRNFGSPTLLPDPLVNGTTLRGMTYPPHQQVAFGNLVRHTLDLSTNTLVSVSCLAVNLEFPRFHQALVGRPYAFVYGCERTADTIGLIKVNIDCTSVLTYSIPHAQCSEPVFVPHPQQKHEDHGVLLTLANTLDSCFLIIVNAVDMKELVRFRIGNFNAVTFHGSFVDYEFQSINVN